MGKVSSNKKIARAQKAGSNTARVGQSNSILFPASLVLVVVLGLTLVVVARAGRDAEATEAPTLADHWHVAYEINVCGVPQAPILDDTDPRGIHTHGDGVIHIHPFSEAAAGASAKLGVFMDANGLEITPDEVDIPGGQKIEVQEDLCGEGTGTPAVVAAYWENADTADETDPVIFTDDFDDIRFLADRGALTIYVGDPDDDVPPPGSIPQLDDLSDVIAPDPTTTTVPSGEDGDEPAGEPSEDDVPADEGDTPGTTDPTDTTDTTTPDGDEDTTPTTEG